MRMCEADGMEEEEGVGRAEPNRGAGCPYISLCDVPDVIHIFDVPLMLHSSNSNGFFAHLRGDVLLHFDAQFFEDQVPYRVSVDRKSIRVVLPGHPPSSDSKPSPARTRWSSREPSRMPQRPHAGYTNLPGW